MIVYSIVCSNFLWTMTMYIDSFTLCLNRISPVTIGIYDCPSQGVSNLTCKFLIILTENINFQLVPHSFQLFVSQFIFKTKCHTISVFISVIRIILYPLLLSGFLPICYGLLLTYVIKSTGSTAQNRIKTSTTINKYLK